MSDLVGTQDVADQLGLPRKESVHTLRRRSPDFPQPVGQLGQALIWSWSDVRAWAVANGRLPEAEH